jgi:hypothetical protein
MTGICVQCDKCGDSFFGTQRQFNGYHWSQETALREHARSLGWTGDMTHESTNDRCPKCAKEPAAAGAGE